MKWFFLCGEIMSVRKSQNADKTEKDFSWNSYFPNSTTLIYSIRVTITKILLFGQQKYLKKEL